MYKKLSKKSFLTNVNKSWIWFQVSSIFVVKRLNQIFSIKVLTSTNLINFYIVSNDFQDFISTYWVNNNKESSPHARHKPRSRCKLFPYPLIKIIGSKSIFNINQKYSSKKASATKKPKLAYNRRIYYRLQRAQNPIFIPTSRTEPNRLWPAPKRTRRAFWWTEKIPKCHR